jgi:hypothetical protein
MSFLGSIRPRLAMLVMTLIFVVIYLSFPTYSVFFCIGSMQTADIGGMAVGAILLCATVCMFYVAGLRRDKPGWNENERRAIDSLPYMVVVISVYFGASVWHGTRHLTSLLFGAIFLAAMAAVMGIPFLVGRSVAARRNE